jgi:hypothetical protein
MPSADFRVSLCVAPCRRLLRFGAAKGQEKGNVSEERLHSNGPDRVGENKPSSEDTDA